jgi:hypothetical protein
MTTTADLEARIASLEERYGELEGALTSGDPLGAAQRLVGQRKAKLAEVQNPAKLTDAKIQEISGDDGSDDPENSANKDVAEGLKEQRSAAKKKGDTTKPKDEPGTGGAR